MMNTNNNHITSFLKVSLFTTILFGGLLAQSYATTLFSDTIMKMNIEFSATDTDTQKASMTVHNEQESSIAFGDHQLDIKSTFFAWEDDAAEHEQVLAEVIIQKLNEHGKFQVIHKPSLVIMRNKWAEIQIDPENSEETFKLKMQFEDYKSQKDDKAFNVPTPPAQPAWLNWGDEEQTFKAEAC